VRECLRGCQRRPASEYANAAGSESDTASEQRSEPAAKQASAGLHTLCLP
jgi:hypothetical protein